MRIIIAIIITAIATKDYIFISDTYLLRGLSQGLCLYLGLSLVTKINSVIIRKYFVVYLYMLTLLVSGILSSHSGYVLFQVLSLFSVILFSMSYCEHNNTEISVFNSTVIIILTTTIFLSLLLALIQPNLAYTKFYEGDAVGYRYRFCGIYPKSSMIACSSGLLFGLALFKINNIWLRYLLIISSSTCLFLTGSRSFWIAVIFATLITIWFYKQKARLHLIIWSAVIIVLISSYLYLSDSMNIFSAKNNAMRTDSISNLSGRTVIWKKGLDGFKIKPLLGYGFSTGAESLIDSKQLSVFSSKVVDDRQYGRSTLHNGYVQSLLDSGIIGFALYFTIIVTSILRLLKYDASKSYPEVLFVIIFYAIANIGESIIGSTASSSGFYFWVYSVIALSLFRINTYNKFENI